MMAGLFSKRVIFSLLVGLVGLRTSSRVTEAATTGSEKFYQAYYLEHSGGDLTQAAKLYEEVAADARADKELRAQAEARLAGCREELATTDFARMMPGHAMAYFELRQPGERVEALLGELGLLTDPKWLPEKGAKQVAISPTLVREAMGIRGAAVAVTGFDPFKMVPSGVLVFHPGDVAVMRGMIETALPSAANAVEPISGYATYDVEGKALITLTSKLVIVSSSRDDIEGVLRRVSGKEKTSLADNKTALMSETDSGDTLMRFFVNTKVVMPVVTGMLSMSGEAPQEFAMAQALLDLNSLQSISGRLDVGAGGLGLQFDLRLDKGHHNLVYNLLRSPAINKETLKCVPDGVAAFTIGSFNEAVSRYGSAGSGDGKTAPIVTLLDFGREIFANITSYAIFVMPPDGAAGPKGLPIPDGGLVFTVNDPAKSEALWTQMLGLAMMATGASGMEGGKQEIDGVAVRTYLFTNGPTVHFATAGNDVVITTNAPTMQRVLSAKRQGKSVMADKAFEAMLSQVTDASTDGVFVHAGRCAEIGRPFMSVDDRKEMEPVLKALSNTTAAFTLDHSDELFRMALRIRGVPNVREIVTAKLMEEQRREEQQSQLTNAIQAKKWDEVLAVVDQQLQEGGDAGELLQIKFKVLAKHKKDRAEALKAGEAFFAKAGDNAAALNGVAWDILTDKKYGDDFRDLALKLSLRSNELSEHENWRHLDTLALAKFETGDAAAAVALEKKAIELCDGKGGSDLRNTLARFEAGVKQERVADESRQSTD